MIRHHRTAIAGLLAAAMFVPACTGSTADPTVTDEATAVEAVVDTLTSSWTWDLRMELELTDAHVAALVDAERQGAGVGVNPAVLEKNLRLTIDEARRQHVHGAFAEDRSFFGAWNRDDHDIFALYVDGIEVYKAASLTPEAAVLAQVDVPRILEVLDDLDAPAPPADVEDIRDGIRQEVEEPDIRAVLLALLDGQPAGIAGMLDLRWFGVTEDDLDEVRQEFRDELVALAAPDRAMEVLDDAITIDEVTHADGLTTASVDVHPRAAAQTAWDLFGEAGASVEGEFGVVPEDDLPETLTDVATLTFDAEGHLVEVRSDLLAFARQLGPLAGDPNDPMLKALDRLRGARADIVVTLGEVGEVDTAMVEPAATMDWAQLQDFFFGEMLGDLGG